MSDTERLLRLERQVATCGDSYEAPSGKIMLRVWVTDLAAVVRLARAAIECVPNTPEGDG